MDDKQRKIVLTSPVWQYKKVIDICNKQSMDGFQLEKIRIFGKSVFKRNDDKKYIYDIDFNGVILSRGKRREAYLDMFKEQGWEFVDNTFNGFSIFRKEYEEGTSIEDYKIYTDTDSSNELYSRLEGLLKAILTIFLPVEFILITLATICFSMDGSFSTVQLILIALVFLLICCLPLSTFLICGIKAVRKMKNEN